MITFLPYPDFRQSLQCLDLNRLRAQRREARDILRLVLRRLEHFDEYHRQTDVLHPAVVMWQGFAAALLQYYKVALEEYSARGYSNGIFRMEEFDGVPCESVDMPPWFGDEALHRSHRIKLFTKLPDHYRRFGWEPEVTSLLGSKSLDEFRIKYVWPGGDGVWLAYRAERQRLARENPATPEIKARVRLGYQSWARCRLCKSPGHRQHNCPKAFHIKLQSRCADATAASPIVVEKPGLKLWTKTFENLKTKRAKVLIDLD
mmetsp:Transcript_45192/g.78338  ORF Transcript_45192/g.78338 Transcript_45192/m.78338 type:complete len:260 (+) Transcript_45192:61-840(+)